MKIKTVWLKLSANRNVLAQTGCIYCSVFKAFLVCCTFLRAVRRWCLRWPWWTCRRRRTRPVWPRPPFLSLKCFYSQFIFSIYLHVLFRLVLRRAEARRLSVAVHNDVSKHDVVRSVLFANVLLNKHDLFNPLPWSLSSKTISRSTLTMWHCPVRQKLFWSKF